MNPEKRAKNAIRQVKLAAIGTLENFKADLRWDAKFIHDTEGKPFAWICRDSGTHIYAAQPEPIDGAGNTAWGMVEYAAALFGADRQETFLYRFWTGLSLVECRDAADLAAKTKAYANARKAVAA